MAGLLDTMLRISMANQQMGFQQQERLARQQFQQDQLAQITQQEAAQQSAAGERQALDLSSQLQLAGVDTRSMPGIGQRLASEGGAGVAASIMNNPTVSPAAAQAQAQAMAEAQQAALEQGQAQLDRAEQRARAIGTDEAMFRSGGQSVGLVQDMRTLYDEVGTETLPTAERGAFSALRFRLLDEIRRTTEAGALQEAEIKLFNEIIPEGQAWTGLGMAEKHARLNQLEYWFKQKHENAVIASGRDVDPSDYYRFGRSYDDILGPVPEGTVEGGGFDGNLGGGSLLEGANPQMSTGATIPGTNIPLPQFGPGGVTR